MGATAPPLPPPRSTTQLNTSQAPGVQLQLLDLNPHSFILIKVRLYRRCLVLSAHCQRGHLHWIASYAILAWAFWAGCVILHHSQRKTRFDVVLPPLFIIVTTTVVDVQHHEKHVFDLLTSQALVKSAPPNKSMVVHLFENNDILWNPSLKYIVINYQRLITSKFLCTHTQIQVICPSTNCVCARSIRLAQFMYNSAQTLILKSYSMSLTC